MSFSCEEMMPILRYMRAQAALNRTEQRDKSPGAFSEFDYGYWVGREEGIADIMETLEGL